jgi:hypothetical protein
MIPIHNKYHLRSSLYIVDHPIIQIIRIRGIHVSWLVPGTTACLLT